MLTGSICMTNEIRLDLETLRQYIEATAPTQEWATSQQSQCPECGAEMHHKGIHALFRSLLIMGSIWRDPPSIILTHQDVEADLDEELARLLDDIARKKIE